MAAARQTAGGSFPTTQWSEVVGAADPDPAVKREALGRLLSNYAPALHAHLVRRMHIPVDRADDLVQGFVCDQIVARNLLNHADRNRGRFRAFVIVALERHVAFVRRSEHALKRSPRQGILPLDGEIESAESAPQAADEFEAAWADQVIQEAIARMRQNCLALGHADVWGVFEQRVLNPILRSIPAMPYEQLVRQFGLASPSQASNVMITGKRMFARCVRAVMSNYEPNADCLEEEIRDLHRILSRPRRSARLGA